jgi:[ribosomal protein S5]-alanine N-acetyltransferase
MTKMITSGNLHLIPVSRAHKEALAAGKPELALLLGVTVPQGWPHFPQAFTLPAPGAPQETPHDVHWWGYFFIDTARGRLVGNGGFKGGPDDAGAVEIGYEVATEYWNLGYATQAAKAMIAFAFAQPGVNEVAAHTLTEGNASNGVLQKAGMELVPGVIEMGSMKVWKWRIGRAAFVAKLQDTPAG